MKKHQTSDFNDEVITMSDLNKTLFRIFIVAALFSFFVLPAQPGFAEETSSSSKVTFHVA